MGGKRKIKKLFEKVEILKKDEELLEFLRLVISFYPKYREKALKGEKFDFLKDEMPFREKLENKGFSIKFGWWRESSYTAKIVYFVFDMFRQAIIEEIGESKENGN